MFHKLQTEVVSAGICVGCGVCVALDKSGESIMVSGPSGPQPRFARLAELPYLAWEACPGKGIDYPELYRRHYGTVPENWLVGRFFSVRTGHSASPEIQFSRSFQPSGTPEAADLRVLSIALSYIENLSE